MFRYINIFTIIISLFLFNCSAPKKEENAKAKGGKECPICPKLKKNKKSKKRKCKPKIVYKSYDKLVIGELENVYIPKYQITLKARIDTGAKTTSIHAENITPFEREGKKWVRFEILDKNKRVIKVKKPIKRMVRIKEGGGVKDRRYVVMMRINISSFSYFGEVNLSDRSSLKYPMLIGRNFIKGHAIVDVSQKFTRKPIKEIKWLQNYKFI